MTTSFEMPGHDIAHHAPWTCVECGDTGEGGAVGFARHHRDHHDHQAPTDRRTPMSTTTQANPGTQPTVPGGRRIYLASSWRNERYPAVLAALRDAGHEVYDFRNPDPDDPTNDGFRWSEITPGMTDAPHGAQSFIDTLDHPIARRGFNLDKRALDWADACVMLLPCGKSAHLELGYAIGQRKHTVVVLEDPCQPELMYLLADKIVASPDDLAQHFADLAVLHVDDVVHTRGGSGRVRQSDAHGFAVYFAPDDDWTWFKYPYPADWRIERAVTLDEQITTEEARAHIVKALTAEGARIRVSDDA